MDEVTSRVETIDATTAKELLNRNERNPRAGRLNTRVVDLYAADMRAGRWPFNGEPIQLDTEGWLLNGQHRLHAVIAADASIPFLVVRGVPTGSAASIDGGYKRTTGQVFSGAGEKCGELLAAVTRLAVVRARMAAKGPGTRKALVGTSEILEFLKANPDLRGATKVAQCYARHIDAPSPSLCGYVAWRLRRIDPYEAERFFIDAAEKVGLVPGDPVLALTRRFAEARRTRTRLTEDEQLSLFFRAWNARRQRRSVSKLAANRGGEAVAIPEPL